MIFAVLAAICIVEGGPASNPLQMSRIALADVNARHGVEVQVADLADPEVAHNVAADYLALHALPWYSAKEYGQTWNRGPKAVERRDAWDYGCRVLNITESRR